MPRHILSNPGWKLFHGRRGFLLGFGYRRVCERSYHWRVLWLDVLLNNVLVYDITGISPLGSLSLGRVGNEMFRLAPLVDY
jgi:hypothetical protein